MLDLYLHNIWSSTICKRCNLFSNLRNLFKMKKLFLLFAILALGSCSKQASELHRESKDKNVRIDISAKREAIGEPWQVLLKVKSYSFKDSIGIEIYNSVIDDKSVSFNWINEQECDIIFEQSDGTRKFHLIATPAKYSLEEVK